MPSTVPTVKAGFRTWLRALPALSGVTVYGAPPGPEPDPESIILGEVFAPQTYDVQDWGPKTERPILTCWAVVTKAGVDDTAQDATVARAYALVGAVETALDADPSMGGVVPAPGRAQLTETGLTEAPETLEGVGGRRAQVRFLIGWESDYTP